MAFSNNGAQANNGPDLETIQTEALGFLSIAGDAKVRLTSAWPSLPAATASLLSIAHGRGLVAAAGPDEVVIATTETVRKAFDGPKDGDSEARKLEPQLRMPMPIRVSQLAFTADEKYLVLSAESGGGLRVYETQALLSGSTDSAFELGTEGQALRALVPNPTTEKAELCAIITENGNLHMANLQQKGISNVLKPQVSCLSWSARGKQLCAGLADGTISQLTPEGDEKEQIPLPPNVSNSHVSSLTWLENNLFLAIHTTSNASPPASIYHLITREPKVKSLTFQKVTDPVEPFGAEKAPHHTLLRLRDFEPNLQDLLIVSSTASSDIGLLTRSKTPLTADVSAESVTGVFTTTELLDDTKRPTLPMTESMDDSVPIGVSLDLSSKDKVYKPIPSDEELEESPTPLPGLWVMTNEGLLCSWWVVYTESIRSGTAYAGLAVAEGSAPATTSAQPSASPFAQPAPSAAKSGVFGASATPAFGAASQLGQKASPWGAPATPAATSTQASQPAFGSSSFGNAPASTSPAFGKPSAFGQPSQLGMRSSPWATGTSGNAPAFGQSGFSSFANNSNNSGASPFSTGASGATSSGGFASFANKSGFASIGNNNNDSGGSIFASKNNDKPNPFASGTSGSTFGQPSEQAKPNPFASGTSGSTFGQPSEQAKPNPFASGTSGSTFGQPSEQAKPNPFASGSSGSTFGQPSEQAKPNPFASTEPKKLPSLFDVNPTDASKETKPNPFASGSSGGLFGQKQEQLSSGLSSGPFQLKSSFTRDPNAANDDAKPGEAQGKSLFGGAFASALSDPANKPPVSTPGFKDEDMGSSIAGEQFTPQANRNLAPTTQESESTTPTTTPAPAKFGFATSPAPGTSLFGQPTKTETPSGSLFGSRPAAPQETPKIKVEEDAPLPPDTTSKATYPLGDSSSSSAASNPTGANTTPAKPETAPPPPDPQATPRPPATQSKAPTSVFSNLKDNAPTSGGLFSNLKPPSSPSSASSEGDEEDSSETAQPPEAPLPPDPVKSKAPAAQSQSSFIAPPAPSAEASSVRPPDSDEGEEEDEDDEDEDEDNYAEDDEEGASEGSGVDVAKDLSPSASGHTGPISYTPQSSFGGNIAADAMLKEDNDRARKLFGEVGRSGPIFPRPTETSPRSPSPVRNAIPSRLRSTESYRSVSAPGMASQLLGPQGSQSRMGGHMMTSQSTAGSEDPFMVQHRRMKARQEEAETQPLVDEEDEQIQKILLSEVELSLVLDEFIAHTNVAPPAQESIPSQVEAVYKDVNAMIDTLGLNSRSVKAFIKGHSQPSDQGKNEEDLDDPDSWVLCEMNDLGDILQNDLNPALVESRVNDKDDKLDECQDLARDVQRLRAKQGDLKQLINARLDPDQADIAQSLPLSAEQAAQQSELRREFAEFSKQLAEAEKALTMLRTQLAAASGSSGRGNSNVPTLEAVMRTITKMTSMVEKRSGDVDVLENQLRKMRLSSASREGSPMVTPRRERSVMFSPETTPSRTFRHSLSSSVSKLGLATPPRKKLSGFSQEEKSDLMERKTRRQAVLAKLKDNVEKRGVSVWNMEDVE